MDKKIKIGIGIIVLVLIGWFFVGQNNEPQNTEPIKIGVISILSGQYSEIGENFIKGVELAKEKYQKENPKIEVKLTVEDDGYNAQKGMSAYKKLTELNNIDALINASSPTINAIYDSVTKTDMPVIQMGEQSKSATEDNIFQIMPGGQSAFALTGEYLKGLKMDSPILLYANDATYKKFADITLENYGDMRSQAIDLSLNDYRTEVAKILEDDPSHIILYMTPAKGALLVKQMTEISDDMPQLIFDATFESGNKEYKKILGDFKKIDGSLIVFPEKFVTANWFKKVYEDKYGEKPGMGSDWGYDAFMLTVNNRARDHKEWLENIKDVKWDGASGRIKFDEVGVRAHKGIDVKVIKDGEMVEFDK